ncbi:hypothetical protein RUND412_006677 [Rhizina undulata]
MLRKWKKERTKQTTIPMPSFESNPEAFETMEHLPDTEPVSVTVSPRPLDRQGRRRKKKGRDDKEEGDGEKKSLK